MNQALRSYASPTAGPLLGADALVARMLAAGIEDIFLFPGGTIAPVLDAAKRNGIRLVCPRHEQGAGYMALADARLRGRVAVLMATSGPGATNLVTPVADAFYDSIPLVVMTGQVGTGDLDRSRAVRQRGFQECDTLSIFKSITKATMQPRNAEELAGAFDEALKLAETGRRGPVLIDLPMNVQRASVGAVSLDPHASRVVVDPTGDPAIADRFAAALMASERPVVIAGAGVVSGGATDALRDLVALHPMPVSCSLAGLGAIPSDDERSLGFHGHTGFRAAGLAVHNADLVLVVGSRLDVRQTGTETSKFAPAARILRIDLDEDEIAHARVRVDETWRAPADAALRALTSALRAHPSAPPRESWWSTVRGWKATHALDASSPAGALRPQTVIHAISSATRREALSCVTGVGSHQQWTARHFVVDHPQRRWFSSCGHGTMGFDLPTANGVAYARPEERVICFVGDGSFLMNVQELAVTAELGRRVLIVVLDNQRLGIVSQFQKLNWGDDPTCGVRPNPDFAAIARGFGLNAATVATERELTEALPAALASTGPFLLHARIHQDEDVVPMLLAGQTMDAMWP
jgi:acetolactate synthase I/II/III large subunit